MGDSCCAMHPRYLPIGSCPLGYWILGRWIPTSTSRTMLSDMRWSSTSTWKRKDHVTSPPCCRLGQPLIEPNAPKAPNTSNTRQYPQCPDVPKDAKIPNREHAAGPDIRRPVLLQPFSFLFSLFFSLPCISVRVIYWLPIKHPALPNTYKDTADHYQGLSVRFLGRLKL